MAIAKVILNGDTLMDVTSNTVTSEVLKTGYTAVGSNGEAVTGGLVAGPYYGLYKCLADRKYPLMASGSSYYGYTASEVSELCNSFVSTNLAYRQFEGINFSGSFYFNNLQYISGYAFVKGWTGNGMSDTGYADLYFPSVSYISNDVFCSNGNIKNIYAPICTKIDSRAFQNCGKLTSVSFPLCSVIKGYAFQSCSLIDINFPNCSYVSDYAFAGCRSLTTIDFSSCTTVSAYAFLSCRSLISVNIPNCSSIGYQAFASCSSLTYVNFSNCISISGYAFANCTALLNISLPKCEYVGPYAFQNCSSLTTINLSNCVSLSNNIFSNCSTLESIYLPLVTALPSSVFYKCYALSVAVFSAVSLISNQAFWECSALTSVYFLGSSIPIISAPFYIFSNTPIYTSSITGTFGSIYVRASLYDSFKTANLWSSYSDRFVSLTDSEIAALSFI